MPDWNPIKEWKELDRIAQVDWIQFVVFGEVGRVDESFSVDELLDDPRWDVGVGLRVLARRTLLRCDVAVAEEGASIWVMVGQAY
jgi:hypothetical protein